MGHGKTICASLGTCFCRSFQAVGAWQGHPLFAIGIYWLRVWASFSLPFAPNRHAIRHYSPRHQCPIGAARTTRQPQEAHGRKRKPLRDRRLRHRVIFSIFEPPCHVLGRDIGHKTRCQIISIKFSHTRTLPHQQRPHFKTHARVNIWNARQRPLGQEIYGFFKKKETEWNFIATFAPQNEHIIDIQR